MKTLTQAFLETVAEFLCSHNISPTRFGMMTLGDPNLMRQIDGGRSPSLQTADFLLGFIHEYRQATPEGRKAMARRARKRTRQSPSTPPTPKGQSPKVKPPMHEPPTTAQGGNPLQILRIADVLALTALSRSTIYMRIRAGTFPPPIALGARAVGWYQVEVEEWIKKRVRRTGGGE